MAKSFLFSCLRWLKPRAVPSLLAALSFFSLGYVAYRGLDENQLSAGEHGAYATITALFGVSAGFRFGKIGRVEPKHARSAVRTLIGIGRDLARAGDLLQDSLGKAAAGQVRELLYSTERSVTYAIEDWIDVHEEALQSYSGGDEVRGEGFEDG